MIVSNAAAALRLLGTQQKYELSERQDLERRIIERWLVGRGEKPDIAKWTAWAYHMEHRINKGENDDGTGVVSDHRGADESDPR